MKLWMVIAVISLGRIPTAEAQSPDDEPTPPGATRTAPAAQTPAAPSTPTRIAEEPAAAPSDEPTPPTPPPTSTGVDEPRSEMSADEPGALRPGDPGADDEEPVPPPAEAASEVAAKPAAYRGPGRGLFGFGLHGRALFVPNFMLKLFYDGATYAVSGAAAAEFIYRKRGLDLIGSVDFAFASPKNGNFLGKGENPITDTDYTQFKDLNFLSFNFIAVGHTYFTKWLSLVYGGGIGVGVVFGQWLRVSNDSALCRPNNFEDPNACYPRGMDPAAREEWLADPAHQGVEADDSSEDPHVWEQSLPPVLPAIHALIGLDFHLSEYLTLRSELGIRTNTPYVGVSTYWFLL